MIQFLLSALLIEPAMAVDAKSQLLAALRQHREGLSCLSGRVTQENTSNSGPSQSLQGFFVYRPGVQRCMMQGNAMTIDTEISGDIVLRLAGPVEKREGQRGPTARFGRYPGGGADPYVFAGILVQTSEGLVLVEDLLTGDRTPVHVSERTGEGGERRIVLRYPLRRGNIEVEFGSEWNYLPIRSVYTGSFEDHGQKKSLRVVREWSHFQEVSSGVYFPTQMVSESFHNDEAVSKSVNRILDLKADPKAVERFPRFRFPENVPVIDYIDKAYYFQKAEGTREPITTKNGKPITIIYEPTAKDEGQSPAEAQIATQAALGPSGVSQPSSVPWIWLGVGAALILLASALLRRYRGAT